MFYKRFAFLVSLRILLLTANVFVLAYIFGNKQFFFNQIILGIILLVQVVDLVRFVNRTNRELARLFFSIRHSDFSAAFQQASLGKSFKELQQAITEIIQAYKQVKIEKEAQFRFLQMLVEQLHIGIITLQGPDTLSLINRTAEQWLGIEGIQNWRFVRMTNPAFVQEVEQLGEQGRKLIELKKEGISSKMLSVDVRSLTILGETYKLITFQDINSEIEQKEIEAWHKLIRILTHEIMNSVTPVSSLTETMQKILLDKDGRQKPLEKITEENIADLRFSLNTIQKRSEGLLAFVDNYRRLTKVPKPENQPVHIKNFLNSIVRLMQTELHQKGIDITLTLQDENYVATFDPRLVEQVIINLITNSVHALENCEKPAITVHGYEDDANFIIEVSDNGKGIPEKELKEIFVPFFSTRKNGSGIGLSLSKQIMSLHGGSIKVQSVFGKGSVFSLYFRKKS